MKRGSLIVYVLILVILIVGYFFHQYLIKIYEANITIEPEELFADNQSIVTLNVIPLNPFGWKALFRNAPADFEIIEGSTLVEIIKLDKEEGKIIIKAKSETGKVVIRITTKYSLLPMIVEIIIHPNLT